MNAAGMIKTSVDMLKERLISKERAILRLNPEDLDQLLHNTIDKEAAKKFNSLTKGIPASPGAATGKAIFDVKKAVQMRSEERRVGKECRYRRWRSRERK